MVRYTCNVSANPPLSTSMILKLYQSSSAVFNHPQQFSTALEMKKGRKEERKRNPTHLMSHHHLPLLQTLPIAFRLSILKLNQRLRFLKRVVVRSELLSVRRDAELVEAHAIAEGHGDGGEFELELELGFSPVSVCLVIWVYQRININIMNTMNTMNIMNVD
jgi:hypothetical protein